ncbi:hypothetical protein TRP8649_02279 [Pelagimonas phthalicica]|uniref:Uncharacterized protein n=1 Tax=Pelagimonas phthalicica TaxID=1037362 RepID=A0A238JD87_9RHOB|nr:Imm27 family immunity protein [Pelagimonas phthalicica]TDS91117.1 immunity protein 27 of polymorphic toxin system [Pelagimonas phthalicica]SMX28164.1 hypothetical protein TRP8649_02279 [Pelagimonas phthalicica]
MEITGKWLIKNGTAVPDENEKEITRRLRDQLDEISRRSDGWDVLLRDKTDGSWWELTFPLAHLHGGGPRKLTLLDQGTAFEKYRHSSNPMMSFVEFCTMSNVFLDDGVEMICHAQGVPLALGENSDQQTPAFRRIMFERLLINNPFWRRGLFSDVLSVLDAARQEQDQRQLFEVYRNVMDSAVEVLREAILKQDLQDLSDHLKSAIKQGYS